MFSTECSGDQMEYDVLAYDSFGRDKQLGAISMIVLAAMLKRTEGFRALQCRNVILDNRDPDFEEGVSLYDRFLRSAEKHFAEEDFLIDTQQLIKQVNEQKEIIAQQNKEISSLKYTITTMAGQKPQTIVYNYGTFNDIHDNPNATIYACPETSNTEEVKPVESSSVSPESDSGSSSGAPDDSSENNSSSVSSECHSDISSSFIFTKKAKKEGKESFIIQALKNSVQGRKDKTRAFVQELQVWQKDDYIDAHYNAQVMYDELTKILPLPFGYDVFKRHYNNTRV